MALIYSAELLHRNEFKQYKQHLKSSEFIERKMPIYLNALEHSFSKIIGTNFPIITSNTNQIITYTDSSLVFLQSSKNQIYVQNLQITEDISNSFFLFNVGFVKLQEMRNIILLKKSCDSKVTRDGQVTSFFQWLKSSQKIQNDHLKTADVSDTIYLINETQKLVEVFNSNFHDKIIVHMLIQPELTIIFSNRLFAISAISNFLDNSFQNVKRKIRYSTLNT